MSSIDETISTNDMKEDNENLSIASNNDSGYETEDGSLERDDWSSQCELDTVTASEPCWADEQSTKACHMHTFIDWSSDNWLSPASELQTLPQNNDKRELSWEESLIETQKRSDSLVTRRLAELGVRVSGDAEFIILDVENKIGQKIAAQRATYLCNRRRERSVLIDTSDELQHLLDRLSVLDHSRPQVVVDCEGLNYRWTGTIDIMELFVRPEDKLYLIDVVALKTSAWSITASQSSFCLKDFLASASHKKIMWDLRMDAHILNKLYGIRLRGIIDASLWAVANRRQGNSQYDNYRMSIETACRENLIGRIDRSELESLQLAKEERARLPPRPWAIRPLPTALIDYAADVKYMGMLYDCFRRRLGKHEDLLRTIEWCTEQDLEYASDPLYCDSGEREPVSPWSSGYFECLQDNLRRSREEIASQAKLLPRLCRFTAKIMKNFGEAWAKAWSFVRSGVF